MQDLLSGQQCDQIGRFLTSWVNLSAKTGSFPESRVLNFWPRLGNLTAKLLEWPKASTFSAIIAKFNDFFWSHCFPH